MLRIDARLLIPGRGAPVPDAAVVVDGERITYAGPADAAPGTPQAETREVEVVMPGLWDCHAHVLGSKTVDLAEVIVNHPVVAGARAVADLEAALRSGVTSIREAGGWGARLAAVIEEGTIVGPTVYGAGAVLSQTGGHADVHRLPAAWVVDACSGGAPFALCDGVPECLHAVRSQLRLGARVIKVCASGGVLSDLDHPVHQQFSDDELRAIVDEAGRADRTVMAHCHGKPGIMAALRAGCRTIEHGTFLDEEAAAAMRDAGATLVPTRFIIERLLARRRELPPHIAAKLDSIADRHLQAIAIAVSAGVTIAAGTDAGTTGPETISPWGLHGLEVGHLVDAGLTPLQAIEAATANAAETLGPQAPRAGIVAAGFDADLLALDSDPLADPAVLDGSHVTAVWKRGRIAVGG